MMDYCGFSEESVKWWVQLTGLMSEGKTTILFSDKM